MKKLKIFALVTAAIFSTLCEAQPWTFQEMLKVQRIKDVDLSNDNSHVLYTVITSSMEKDQFVHSIYKSSLDNTHSSVQLTDLSSSSTQAAWSPDNSSIAFISDRNGKRNIFVMDPSGNNVRQLTDEAEDVQNFKWSPNGEFIAFVMADAIVPPKELETSYVVDKDSKINRLWIIAKDGGRPRPLTSDAYFVRGSGGWGTTHAEFDWSPDSSKIAFGATKHSGFESFFLTGQISIVDILTKVIVDLPKVGESETTPRFSPDGKSLVFLESEPECSYLFARKIVVSDADGSHRRYLAKTPDEGPYLMGQNLIGWTPDGNNVLFLEPSKTRFSLYLLPKDGSPAIEWNGPNLQYNDICLSKNGSLVGFTGQLTDQMPELYVADFAQGEAQQVSNVNVELLDHPLPKTEVIKWKARDGKTIEGLLTFPIDYVEGQSYPLLLEVHGGPMAFYSETCIATTYIYPLPVLSQEGFFVLRSNPRGSCGYGKEFRALNLGDIGGEDYFDVMSGVDYVISKYKADPERLGIMGWSYGGYMSAWAITQTDRFKAASIGAAITNLVSMAGTMDLSKFISGLLMTNFWENRDLFIDRSPIHHILNVKTPCLILHGDADFRVPVSQGYEFYHALKKLGHNPHFVVYPKMQHSPSKPKQYLNLMENNHAWFTHHLSL